MKWLYLFQVCQNPAQSPPARGAWIEILCIYHYAHAALVVAPRTGGVD